MSNYLSYLLTKRTLKPATIKRKLKVVKSLIKHGVEISDPDSVVAFLNTCSWENGTKAIAIDAYRDYLNMLGLTGIALPYFKRTEKLPFIPLESEIDTLIAAVRIKMACFLRLLKETAFRPIEAWSLKWENIDLPRRNVTITPAKYSKPRRFRITEQLLNMILVLPRKNPYVFSPSGCKERLSDELEHFARNYSKQRRRIALKLRNRRIKRISLRTFRHWKATTEYVRTKDIVHVKELLGHVNINNTLKYVHIANAITNNEDSYVCKVAKTVKEAKQLIEIGFQYVTDMEDVKLFRKLK